MHRIQNLQSCCRSRLASNFTEARQSFTYRELTNSFSRSGEPNWSNVSDSNIAPAWSAKVEWAKGDILHRPTYEKIMEGAQAAVHSMGILFEANYKPILAAKDPVGTIQQVLSSQSGTSKNPLENSEDQSNSSQNKPQLTYELMNRDSGMCRSVEGVS
jgi:hypothetical protein